MDVLDSVAKLFTVHVAFDQDQNKDAPTKYEESFTLYFRGILWTLFLNWYHCIAGTDPRFFTQFPAHLHVNLKNLLFIIIRLCIFLLLYQSSNVHSINIH